MVGDGRVARPSLRNQLRAHDSPASREVEQRELGAVEKAPVVRDVGQLRVERVEVPACVTIRSFLLDELADAAPTSEAATSSATPMLSMNRESKDFLGIGVLLLCRRRIPTRAGRFSLGKSGSDVSDDADVNKLPKVKTPYPRFTLA